MAFKRSPVRSRLAPQLFCVLQPEGGDCGNHRFETDIKLSWCPPRWPNKERTDVVPLPWCDLSTLCFRSARAMSPVSRGWTGDADCPGGVRGQNLALLR